MGSICTDSKIRTSVYRDNNEKVEILSLNKKNSLDQKGRLVVPASVFVVQKDYNIFLQEYQIISELGQGAFGVVKMVKHKETKSIRAMKIVYRQTIMDDNLLRREIEILKTLDHPNILKIYEFFSDSHNFYVITEYCNGGELFDKISEMEDFNEKMVAMLMKQILSAVYYMHNQSICHRDLKPENILLETTSSGNEFNIKIIDFGTATFFNPKVKMNEVTGTAYYIAPEVLKENYDKSCDLWSCGVILYILLTGTPPFDGESQEEIFKSVKVGKPDYNIETLQNVSNEAISLLKKLLTYIPEHRVTAHQALNDVWLKNIDDIRIDKSKSVEILNNMKNFKSGYLLAQATLSYLVNQILSKEDIVELRKAFQALDKNNDGLLSYKEIVEGYRKIYKSNSPESDAKEVFELVDQDKSGTISYEEFIKATINKTKFITDNKIEQAFKLFDKNNDGSISANEIKDVLGKGMKLSKTAWMEIVNEVDTNGDGEISIEEFKIMMKKLLAK